MNTQTINFRNSFKLLCTAWVVLMAFSCSDDNDKPVIINEEEVITTMNITLTASGGSAIMLQSKDLDGDGPDAPIVTVSGDLAANTTYTGAIVLLNQTVSPAEDITLEVKEEADEHQFIFIPSGAINGAAYEDQDANGNPIGIKFTLTTSDAGSATLRVVLRHQPKKPNDGTLADAGGETDIEQTFTLNVQ